MIERGRLSVASETLRLLARISWTGVRDLLLEGVRESAIDLRPLSAPLRLITLLGVAMVLALLGSILFSDVLRQSGSLVSLAQVSGSRGVLVPAAAIPLTWIGIFLAWLYLLVGTHYLRWPLRLALLFLYGVSYSATVITAIGVGDTVQIVTTLMALSATLLLILLLLFIPQGRLPLPLLWVIVLLLHANPSLFLLAAPVPLDALSWKARLVSSLVTLSFSIVIPFLMLAGLEWVTFAREVSRWAVESVRTHANRAFVTLLLVLGLVVRWLFVVGELMQGTVREWGWGLLGAGLLVVGLLPIALWRRRFRREDPLPGGVLAGWVGAYVLPQSLILIAVTLLSVVLVPLAVLANDTSAFDGMILFWSRLSNIEPSIRNPLFVTLALLVALLAARRGRIAIATYALILGWWRLLVWLTGPGLPAHALQFGLRELDVIVLLLLSGLTLLGIVRRSLTRERAIGLLAALLLMALLNQTDFLDNPFSPLFAFAGIFFLVFSIFWSVLTAGTFANQETPALPRTARLLLYLGYALLAVVVAHWFVVIHDVPSQSLQASFNFQGFLVFGTPLVLLILIEHGLEVAEGREQHRLHLPF